MRDHIARLCTGYLNWQAAIRALMERDARTRFAGGRLGHAWAIITPVSWILAIALFFRWAGRSAPIDASLPAFLATGMVPYLVFRQSVTSALRALKANRHLMTFSPVRPEDIFTATALLEMINAAVIFTVVLALTALMAPLPLPRDPLLVIWALALATGLGAATGRLAAILARTSDAAMRSTPILLRPLFWVSGIFFVSHELTGPLVSILWFNPLFHIIEMLRSGYFPGFSSQMAGSTVPLVGIACLYLASRVLETHQDLRPGVRQVSP